MIHQNQKKITIEKGFPIPMGKSDGFWKMTLVKMIHGDSFVAPKGKENAIRRAASTLKKSIVIRGQGLHQIRIWMKT